MDGRKFPRVNRRVACIYMGAYAKNGYYNYAYPPRTAGAPRVSPDPSHPVTLA